jgi:hypothetical protein
MLVPAGAKNATGRFRPCLSRYGGEAFTCACHSFISLFLSTAGGTCRSRRRIWTVSAPRSVFSLFGHGHSVSVYPLVRVFLLRAAGLVLFPRTTEQYCSRYTVIDFTTRMLTILYIRIDTCQSQRFASAALLYFAVDKLR